jgi:hypothetical protein
MKMLNIVFMAASLLLVSAAFAGEHATSVMQIAIDDGSDGEEIVLNLNGADMGFNLHDMQEGESHSIVDESGRAILITREADGIKFNVDGKTIDMPLFDGAHEVMMISDVGPVDFDMDFDSNVHVMGTSSIAINGHSDGVTIMSGKPIDDVVREKIESVLISSGHSDGVTFIDRSSARADMHKIISIKKEVVAND